MGLWSKQEKAEEKLRQRSPLFQTAKRVFIMLKITTSSTLPSQVQDRIAVHNRSRSHCHLLKTGRQVRNLRRNMHPNYQRPSGKLTVRNLFVLSAHQMRRSTFLD